MAKKSKKLSALELIQQLSGNVKNVPLHVAKEREYLTPDYHISFGSILLNCLITGDPYLGLPGNIAITLTGHAGTGKTLAALLLAKNFYDMFPTEAVVNLNETEGASNADQWAAFVNLDNMLFTPVKHVLHLKQSIKEQLKAIERGVKYMIITDSIGALPDSEQYTKNEKGDGTKVMGKKAQEVNTLYSAILDEAHSKHVPMIFINRKFTKFDTNKYTPREEQESTSGGQGNEFSPSVSLDFRKKVLKEKKVFYNEKGEKKEKTVPIGVEISVFSDKNRFGKEYLEIPIYIDHDKGFMKYYGLVNYAIKSDLLTKGTVKGRGGKHWWHFTFDEENLFETTEEITAQAWESALNNGLADYLRKEFTRSDLFVAQNKNKKDKKEKKGES